MNEIVQSGGIATLIATLDMDEIGESKPELESTNQNDVDLRFLKPAFALMRVLSAITPKTLNMFDSVVQLML